MAEYTGLHKALAKLVGEFNWDYIAGRMRGKKWKWMGADEFYYPDRGDLASHAIGLALEFAKEGNESSYLSCGGITIQADRKAQIVTVQFGKKNSKPWLSATEKY